LVEKGAVKRVANKAKKKEKKKGKRNK